MQGNAAVGCIGGYYQVITYSHTIPEHRDIYLYSCPRWMLTNICCLQGRLINFRDQQLHSRQIPRHQARAGATAHKKLADYQAP